MVCDIIIPVWNQLKLTRECIESIKRNTRFPYRLILIDNASDKKTAKYLRSVGAAHLIRNEENLGFVKAVNQGLRVFDAPYACIMNNDTICTEGWLQEMIKVLQSRKDIGLVNPSSNNIGQHPGANDTIDGYAAGLKKMSGQFVEMGACIGFCMLFTRDLFDAVGYLDEVYKEGNFDDTDYSRRVEKAGFLCVRAKAAYVYHHIKSSFGKIKSYEESFKRNQEVYNKRWGRPKRLLYVVTKSHGRLFDWMQQDIFKKARSGNWIWLYFKKGDMQDVMNEHSNMKLFTLPEFLFELNCITRILTKKKRFDSIFVDDPRLIERIKKLERFHKADTTLMGG